MFYNKCVQASIQTQPCVICGQPGGKVLPIGSSLPQTLMEMFNKNQESMAKINKRLEFQDTHVKRCLTILSANEQKLLKKKKSLDELKENLKRELAEIENKIREKEISVKRLSSAVDSLRLGSSGSSIINSRPPALNTGAGGFLQDGVGGGGNDKMPGHGFRLPLF